MDIINSLQSLCRIRSWSLSLVLWSATFSAFCADWPQFLGPNGNAVSSEKGLVRAWDEKGPKVLWTIPLGAGYGGAAIRDGEVYLLDRMGQEKDVLRCLDLNTGKEKWTFDYDAPGRIDHEGSRSTPAVTEHLVFTIGPFGQLHCLDRKTHQVQWKKNILSDYGATKPRWSVSQSPLLYRDMVIVAPQSDQKGIVALDQVTGKEKWHSASIGPMAYGSPMLIRIDGMDQIVIVNPRGASAVSAEDGKVLWQYAHPCKIPIPNVTVLGNGKLFITGAYMAGSAIFQVSRQGDNWEAKELVKIEKLGGHCHPAILYQDHLYLLCNTNERPDEGLVCFDSKGAVIWQTKRNPNFDKGGSLLTGDGLIYMMDGRTGELHIVEPSSQGFKSLSKAKLLEGREIWGPLALSNGKLLIRDQTQMKCLDISGQ